MLKVQGGRRCSAALSTGWSGDRDFREVGILPHRCYHPCPMISVGLNSHLPQPCIWFCTACTICMWFCTAEARASNPCTICMSAFHACALWAQDAVDPDALCPDASGVNARLPVDDCAIASHKVK